MNFNESKPIYLQIADFIVDKIVTDNWKENNRIPSVRELGVELEVNPNTVMRAYEWLSERNIVYNKRGIGFFVSVEAKGVIIEFRREELFEQELKSIAKSMIQLGVTIDEIVEHLNRHINCNCTE